MVGWMGAMLRISKTKQLCNFYFDAYSASITGGAMINAFYWAQKKKADRYVKLALIEAVFNGGHWNDCEHPETEGKKTQKKKKYWWLSHGSLHHGLFLCSVLGIGYLAEVDTAAFSTDPYFGWPPIHCLVAIQIVWDGVLRHQWSWDAKEERKRQSGGRKRVSTRQEMTAGDQLWGLPWTLSVMWLVIRLIMIITTFNN